MSDSSAALESNRPGGGLALGTALVFAGQASFVLCGYLLHFGLSRAIDPVAYGVYGVMMSLLTWTESALSNGVPWAVRKLLPADPGASRSILRSGLLWQMIVAGMVYAASMVVAPWFAGAVNDASLVFYVRVALTDIFFMALYTFYRGALNGFRMFGAQGASMAAYSITKVALSLLLVKLGYSLTGALVGNVLGSVAGWLAAWWMLRVMTRRSSAVPGASKGASERYGGRTILRFAIPSVLFTLAGTFLTSVGLFGVKARAADGRQVAYYAAANYLSTAVSVLLVSFSMTLFPRLAGAIAARDWSLARADIRAAVRYLGLALVPGVFLVFGTSSHLIGLVYPGAYAQAAPLLNLLIISTGLHALYMIFANAIMAEGRVLLALSVPCSLVPVALLSTWYLTGRFGPIGAAYAAVLTTALASLGTAVYVLRRFEARLDLASLARTMLASLGIYGLTRVYVARGALLVPYYVGLGAIYFALLMVLGEIRFLDLQRWSAAVLSAVRDKAKAART